MSEDGSGGCLARNLMELSQVQPALASFLATTEPEVWQCSAAASGDLTARHEGKLLHSARDPRNEAARLVAAALPGGADTAVILGAGLGYAIEAAFELPGIERVILCEALPQRIVASLDARDLSSILSREGLSYVAGGDPGAILAALEDTGARIAGLVGQRALETGAEPWYAAVRAAFERFAAKESINENTVKRFGRLWVRNIARNSVAAAAFHGIQGLASRFAGFPALVLAAGPSLDEVLSHIQDLRQRCLIVAVDTSLRSLLARGVEPDFVLVVDPQYWNWRHVADLEWRTSYLVTEPAVWPPALRCRFKGAFVAASVFPLGRALFPGDRGALGAGGSVATSAWDFARHIGAGTIYMAGLDLGYPVGHTHARASLFEQRAIAAGSRLHPSSTTQAAAVFTIPTQAAKANDGGSILTDARMTLYAWWFEARLARRESPPTRTLSQRGLAIPGMALSGIEALLELPPRRNELDAILHEIGVSAASTPQGLASALPELISSLSEIEQRARKGAEAAEAWLSRGSSARGGPGLLAILDEVDAFLRDSAARDVVGFLLPSLRSLFSRAPTSFEESVANSASLYHHIVDSAHEHLELFSPETALEG